MRYSRFTPLLFVLLWSTGFIGAKYGLPYAEPFNFLAIRLAIASVLLFAIAMFLKAPLRIGRRDLAISALIGLCIHGLYLGGVFYAISRGVSAGVSALIVSLQPVVVSILSRRMLGEKTSNRKYAGLAIGLLGVILVLLPRIHANESAYDLISILSILLALAGGSVGTLLQKELGSQIPVLVGTSVQYVASGLFFTLLTLLFETQEIQWNLRFVGALTWLILVLSLGAILLLYLLLQKGSASTVSSLYYLVPPATAIGAYFLFGEPLELLSIAGIAICATGVWLVLREEVDS